ncbi:MAG: efflux RND transporter permease subunit [Epsilonproteobacteria bacterium]|nr:efflux RND transporter permease subunit [Campylobacterota bacterium]
MIKSLVKFFIEKSILNHVFLLFLFLLGAFAYIKIPKEIFPPMNLDAISITGQYGGASPDILDKMAVTTIEDELKNLSDIGELKSTIKNGAFSIKADLKEDANAENALSDVKDIISNIRRDLPSDMDEPVAKKITNSFPLVTIAIASTQKTENLLKIADELKSRLASIKDLSEISIWGDVDTELLFTLEDQKIEALNLDRNAIVTALSSLSTIFPVGMIKERGNHLFLSTYNGSKEIKEIQDTLISVGGKRVRIKDIAHVAFTLSDPTTVSHFNALPNIAVNINKAKTGNSIALVKEIREVLKEYEKKYEAYQFEVYTDTSIWIRNRLNTVISNIIFGLILVGLSIFLFINARISMVVSIGIPTSFLIGLIATQLLGYSLNMLSLLGALIALGMLVDEAIVVAENIQRHLEDGDDPKTAAINGAAEMFPAVLTATATTIFAFLPLLIMSGEMGVFMKILPIMISILLLSSLFEAFFFLPLHAKEILHKEKQNLKSKRFWSSAKTKYTKILDSLLQYRKTALGVFLIFTLVSTAFLLYISKFQLFPDFDTTQVYVSGKVNKNYDLQETQAFVTEVEKTLIGKLDDNDVSSITSISGMKLDNKSQPLISENFFHIFVNLHERSPENFFNTYINPLLSPEYDDSDMIRMHSAKEVSQRIQTLTEEIQKNPEFEEFNVIVPGAGIVESDIALSFTGDEQKIKTQLERLQIAIAKVDGVYNVTTDLIQGEHELKFKVNLYGQSLGINEKVISNALKPLFLKAEISKMFYQGKLIRIKSQDIGKDSISTLEKLYITVPNSKQKVKLSEVVEFIKTPSYATLYKEDAQKIWTLYGSLDKTRITSSEFLAAIQDELTTIEKEGVTVIIKGEEKENKKIQKEMMQAAIIALFLIFIALIWMFNSLSLSLFVLSTIPLAIFGVLAGHIIMGLNLTMPGMLGIVGLAGVVVNDGIIMIDFLRKAENHTQFIAQATLRLRPILLTSITTVLGLSTLILFASGQAVILQPMAVSLGFGIAWATILNLLFLPLLYAMVHKIR